jgi:hypothetical protein
MIFDWCRTQRDYEMPKIPKVETPKPEETYYSVGITSEDRVTLRIGYSTLTMNHKGCEHLIEQLEVFMKQIKQEETDA